MGNYDVQRQRLPRDRRQGGYVKEVGSAADGSADVHQSQNLTSWGRRAFTPRRILLIVASGLMARVVSAAVCSSSGLDQNYSGLATMSTILVVVWFGAFRNEEGQLTSMATMLMNRPVALRPARRAALQNSHFSGRVRRSLLRFAVLTMIVLTVAGFGVFASGSTGFLVIVVLLTAFTIALALTLRFDRFA